MLVTSNKDRRIRYISKPVLQALGSPDHLKLIIQDGYVEVRWSD